MGSIAGKKSIAYSWAIILLLLLFWFLAKALFFATTTSPGIPPDEMYQLQVIDLYRISPFRFPFHESSNLFVEPLTKYGRFGVATEFPYLYHASFGAFLRLMNLSAFEFSSIVGLRVLNLGISFLTLYYFYQILRLFKLSREEKLLAFTLHTNILMFTLLSGSVSYDNLLNLFATSAIFFLFSTFFYPKLQTTLCFMACILAGAMVKLSFLPLALIFVGVWVGERMAAHAGFDFLRRSPSSKSSYTIVGILLSIIAVLAYFNIEYLGANVVRYGKILPSCVEVYSETLCEANEYFRTEDLLAEWVDGKPQVGVVTFLGFWFNKMVDRSFGIWGHAGMALPPSFLVILNMIFGYSVLMAVVYMRRVNPAVALGFFIAMSYGVFVAIYYHYLPNRVFSQFGINGRYIFPVLSCLCIAFAHFVLIPFKGIRKQAVMVVIVGFLLLIEIPVIHQQEVFKKIMAPKDKNFYRQLPYAPNAVYDRSFRLLELPPEANSFR